MSVSYRRRARVRLKICEICWTKIFLLDKDIRVNPCRSVVKKNLRDLRDLREIRYLCESVLSVRGTVFGLRIDSYSSIKKRAAQLLFFLTFRDSRQRPSAFCVP